MPAAGWAQFVVVRNLLFYAWRLRFFFGLPTVLATVIAACLIYVLRFRQREQVSRLALYAAWAVAVLPVPLVAWMNDERYLFGGFPAYLVILLDITWLAAEKWLTYRGHVGPPSLVAVLLFGLRCNDNVTYASGPFEAAEYVWQQRPERVLVCGRGEYQFIFKTRCLAGDQPSIIIFRGSKVPPNHCRPKRSISSRTNTAWNMS